MVLRDLLWVCVIVGAVRGHGGIARNGSDFVKIIYSGQACGGEASLPHIFANNVAMIVEPLARDGVEARLYGWFEGLPARCADGRAPARRLAPPSRPGPAEAERLCGCAARIASLANWTDLVFSEGDWDSDPSVTRSRGDEARGVRRRSAALRRFAGGGADAPVVLLRPDLWFRRPLRAWGVDFAKDITVAHRECGRYACGPFSTARAFQASDALWVLRAAAVPKILGAAGFSLDRNAIGPNLTLTYNPTPKRRGSKPKLVASVGVLEDLACCHNTRSTQWHPLYAVGLQCCFARAGGGAAPKEPPYECFPARSDPFRVAAKDVARARARGFRPLAAGVAAQPAGCDALLVESSTPPRGF